MLLSLSKIRMDGGTQSRACIDPETVSEYADAIHGGAEFPPPVVFFDGEGYWVADGFHRLYALRKLARHDVECKVVQGTRRDAVLYSVGANATHGKRRTNADKRIAVETLLKDEEWSAKGTRWIADTCGVGHNLVATVARESNCTRSTVEGRDGKTRDVSNIGKSKPKPAPAFEPVAEDDDGPESAPRPIPTAHRPEPAPTPAAPAATAASAPPAKRDVEGERRHLFTLLPTDRRLADALWTVGQLTASERRELLAKIES